MFILTGEINQKIVIGDNIEVVVLDVKDDQIKIGLDVPKEMSVVSDSCDSKCAVLPFSAK